MCGRQGAGGGTPPAPPGGAGGARRARVASRPATPRRRDGRHAGALPGRTAGDAHQLRQVRSRGAGEQGSRGAGEQGRRGKWMGNHTLES